MNRYSSATASSVAQTNGSSGGANPPGVAGTDLGAGAPRNAAVVAGIEPKAVWKHFASIAAIPHCSGNEAGVMAYIEECAQSRALEVRSDRVGNRVVIVPATDRYTDDATTILQAHVDMVCEKNEGTDHDFAKDGVRLVRDEGRIIADRTTLGADNGIGVAMMLALLETDFAHGPIELLFTVDEESGLTGAKGLDPSLLTGSRLINLDYEEEGRFCIGCAGGGNTTIRLPLERTVAVEDRAVFDIVVRGLRGGHSGIEIGEGRANAIHLAADIVSYALRGIDGAVADITGGDKHNAIPREARVRVVVGADQAAQLRDRVSQAEASAREEYGTVEPTLEISVIEAADVASEVLTKAAQCRLLSLLQAIPHGVLRMSPTIPGMVETSVNLASVRAFSGEATILISRRSSLRSALQRVERSLEAIAALIGATTEADAPYSPWTPADASNVVETCTSLYRRVAGREPIVETVHAGLECGVIGDKMGALDMVSFGPDITGVHTPDEAVDVASVARVWGFLLELLSQRSR